jgi:translation elongation factor EF-G
MKPIITLIRNVMDGQLDLVWKMLETLQITLNSEQKERRLKDLMKIICQKWINAAEALLEMIIMKLPSPKKA